MDRSTTLYAGESLHSQNGRFEFMMQKDGDLAQCVPAHLSTDVAVRVVHVSQTYPSSIMCSYRNNIDGTRKLLWRKKENGVGNRVHVSKYGRLRIKSRSGKTLWKNKFRIGVKPRLLVANNGRVQIGRSQLCVAGSHTVANSAAPGCRLKEQATLGYEHKTQRLACC